jgi:hypothetical protein
MPVEQFGEMRSVMREGRTEPRVRLASVASSETVYAVGALAGLEGEITIAGGKTWVARVSQDALVVRGPQASDGDQATLLTVANVDRWESDVITTTIQGTALEETIEQVARSHGIDTARPFPFLIEGEAVDLDIHVINGYCPIGTDPVPVSAKPWRRSGGHPGRAVVVGFYAAHAEGIMTHHGSSIHAHAILTVDGQVVTGHVERLGVGPGTVVRTPLQR